LASGFIKVKMKASFWFRDYKQFKVAFVWKPGVKAKAAQKPEADVGADQKPANEK
jgi:hypothetical protein